MSPSDGHRGTRTRVLIVEDHKVVADGLAMLLEDDPLIEVVGCAATGTEAIAAAQTNAPDVVLLDYRLPDQSGAEVAAAIKMDSPDSAIVFLSADDSEGAMLAAVRAGGCGYLVKTEAGSKKDDQKQPGHVYWVQTSSRATVDGEDLNDAQPAFDSRNNEPIEIRNVKITELK